MPMQLTALWDVPPGPLQRRRRLGRAGTVVEKVILTAIFAALASPSAPSSWPRSRPRPIRSTSIDLPSSATLSLVRCRRRAHPSSRRSVVVPVVMLLLLVAVQLALWAHAAQVVQLAASEGDRTARSIGGGPAAGVAAGADRGRRPWFRCVELPRSTPRSSPVTPNRCASPGRHFRCCPECRSGSARPRSGRSSSSGGRSDRSDGRIPVGGRAG